MLLAAAILLLRTGDVPLIDPDEPRVARTSVEMLRSGDPVVPLFDGRPRLVKPPLVHWLQVPLYATFGAREWTARLPAALATLVSLWLVGAVARRRFGDEGAVWAAAFFICFPLVVVPGRVGTYDALLSVHITAAVALDLLAPDGWSARRGGAFGALLGLGFLVKGPAALLLPLLILLAGRTAAGMSLVPGWRVAATAAGACLAVIAPWGLALIGRIGLDGVAELLQREALDRYVSGTDHVKPLWFYVPVLLVGAFPFVVPLLTGTLRAFWLRRKQAGPTAPYCAGALVAGVLFFSLGQGKLPNYLVPLMPLAAWLTTWELARDAGREKPGALVSTLLAGSLAAFGVILPLAARRYPEVPHVELVGWLGGGLWIAAALVALYGALRLRPRLAYGAAVGAAAGFLLLLTTVLLPSMSTVRSARGVAAEIEAAYPQVPVAVVDMKVPSLLFYLDRPVEEVDLRDLPARLDRPDDLVLVFDPDDLERLEPAVRRRIVEVASAGKYRICRRAAEAPAGGVLDGKQGSG